MQQDGLFDPLDAVAQMFTAAKAVLTPLEGQLWFAEVERLGEDRLLAFAAFWLSGAAGVNRAPRVQDFRRYCDPNHLDESLAFDALIELVKRVGPYETPTCAPRLYAVIHALDGWPAVCRTLPDPSEEFKVKRWRERFAAAYQTAIASEVQGLPQAPQPLGLVANPQSALLLQGQAATQWNGLELDSVDEPGVFG